MPKGKPKNGLWRGQEPLEKWLARQEPRPCACGCGELVIPKKAHRNNGIPRFILGHTSRAGYGNYKGVDKWVAAQQGKHFCACGCNEPITILPIHHCQGIPRFILYHHQPPRVGPGPEHPGFINDRSLVKTRGGHYFTPATMRAIRMRCNGNCVRCGSSSELKYDHIIPIFRGGGAEASNGQLLCRDCHRFKTQLELVLTRSPTGIRRFFKSLIAFIEFAEQEITRNADTGNTAHLS